MGRSALWTAIRDTLGDEIAVGRYKPGDRMPTEAQLAARFGVNRHTVRRALASLASNGTIFAKRGSGVFVAHRPTTYPLGKRVRFHQNLSASGHMPGKKVLHLAHRLADPTEAEALGLTEEDNVTVYEGLSFSDGTPIALFRSVFPLLRFPRMSEALASNPSVTSAFGAHGVRDYTRASTRITAKLATSTQANHLQIEAGAPILRATSVNIDTDGVPIEFGRTWFAGDRVTLSLVDSP